MTRALSLIVALHARLANNVARVVSADEGAAARAPRSLQFTYADGTSFELADGDNSGPNSQHFAVEASPDGRFVTVYTVFRQGQGWALVDLRGGRWLTVGGYPLFAPGGGAFVAAEQDIDFGHTPNVLAVWQVDSDGAREVFNAIAEGDQWGPAHVRWLDDRRVQFSLLWWDTSVERDAPLEAPAMLVASGQTWVLDAAGALRPTNDGD